MCQSVIKTFSPANECVWEEIGRKGTEVSVLHTQNARNWYYFLSFVMVAANRGGEAFKVYAQLA